ncbi:MAG TPA: hypothetical protein VK897_26455 [Anaerolineales bacterium]|nr:hypothetical protein [Anaerolineales bacterium]
MTKSFFLQLIFLGAIVTVTACQSAGQPGAAAMSRPGDSLGGMDLATGAADAPPLWAFCAAAQGSIQTQTLNCRAPVLPALAIGHIFLVTDETFATLNWSNLDWELSIDDQPVDLESFGKFEYDMPSMSKNPSPVREVFKKGMAWNIMLTNLKPGIHTLRFQAHNGADSYNWIVNLTIEPAEESIDGTDISSIPFQPKS